MPLGSEGVVIVKAAGVGPRPRRSRSTVDMIDHNFPTPVLRVFQLLEDWSIHRLTDAEHGALAGMNFSTVSHGIIWFVPIS
jgi:hypothetical protein